MRSTIRRARSSCRAAPVWAAAAAAAWTSSMFAFVRAVAPLSRLTYAPSASSQRSSSPFGDPVGEGEVARVVERFAAPGGRCGECQRRDDRHRHP